METLQRPHTMSRKAPSLVSPGRYSKGATVSATATDECAGSAPSTGSAVYFPGWFVFTRKRETTADLRHGREVRFSQFCWNLGGWALNLGRPVPDGQSD